MQRQGIALVLSAPSGAGKSTLCRKLCADFPNIRYSVSCTTRSPRGKERDGVDYYFLSTEEFFRRREENYFAEWASVHGNFYGTPLPLLEESLALGQDVLLDIDVQGAAQVKLSLPTALFCYILPPSMDVLEKRLRLRATDSEASISRRLEACQNELSQARWFDALIVNDNLEEAYRDLVACYRAATLAPFRNRALLDALITEGSLPNDSMRG